MSQLESCDPLVFYNVLKDAVKEYKPSVVCVKTELKRASAEILEPISKRQFHCYVYKQDVPWSNLLLDYFHDCYLPFIVTDSADKVIKFISGLIVSVDLTANLEYIESTQSIRIRVSSSQFSNSRTFSAYTYLTYLYVEVFRSGEISGSICSHFDTTRLRLQAS